MSPVNEPLTDFERNARTVLEASLQHIDARTRSRLNQARHAALAAVTAPRPWWRSYTLMPAGAAAAALLVTVALWHREPMVEAPGLEAQHAVVEEDMDLLADSEGLELMDNWDGSFYEWAPSESDPNAESDG